MLATVYLKDWDFVLAPAYMFVFYQAALFYQKSKQSDNPHYRYFANGLLIKMVGGFIFCLVYSYYYKGGDSTQYHASSVALNRLSFKKFSTFLKLMGGDRSVENYFDFDFKTGWPEFWWDPQSFAVVRFSSLLQYFSFDLYMPATMVLCVITYSGIWRLYLVFVDLYPHLYKVFALSVLFVPSICFWGSGIMKDSYTLAGSCWVTYCVYNIFIKKSNIALNVFSLFVAAFIVIRLKPYIFVSQILALFFWIASDNLFRIKNVFFRLTIGPFIFSVFLGISFLFLSLIKGQLGVYSSLDSILLKASETQNDLKQEYNKGNSFDIGSFDPTLAGIASKFFPALMAGMFRPYLWDAKNIMMVFSALENTLIFLFLLYMVVKYGPSNFFSNIFSEPVVFFCLAFALFFSFSVGLTTANFGSLVRYKIPQTAYLITGLVLIWRNLKKQRARGSRGVKYKSRVMSNALN